MDNLGEKGILHEKHMLALRKENFYNNGLEINIKHMLSVVLYCQHEVQNKTSSCS